MGTGMSILTGLLVGAGMMAVLVVMIRTGRPLRQLLSSFVQGICAVAAVDVIGVFTGVSLGFSWFSMISCVAFGMPGVISMLLMHTITL